MILDQAVRLHANGEVVTDPRNFPGLWVPEQQWVWDHATFTVPDNVSEDRVQFAASKYQLKYGKSLEKQGLRVLEMGKPEVNRGIVARGTTEPDRRPYVIWAKVTRRPVEVRMEVPDEDVGLFQKAGFCLVE